MEAAGRLFRAFFLVLLPVAVQLSSAKCVNYGHQEVCALKGSSVEFPCSYPSPFKVSSLQGWSKKWRSKSVPLDKLRSYKVRMSYLGSNGSCTMKLANLTTGDASIYYFIYNFRDGTSNNMRCKGIPGVKLHVLASPVNIFVESIVGGQKTLVTDWTVMEGQRITLTCARTCAANLNSNPGYIWYKNKLQLNSSQVNSPYLSLHPVIKEDTGSYVCALIDYRDLPSSAVNLIVQHRPRNTMSCETQDSEPKSDSRPTPMTPTGTSLFPIPMVLIVSVSFGLVITVVMLGLNMRKRRRCVGSIPATPNSNSHIYMTLDINSISPEYDTLNTVRRSSADDADYENLPGNSSR